MPVSRRAVVAAPAGVVLTPVEMHGGHSVKRDDLADERGVRGGKARTLGAVCRHVVAEGLCGLTVYAARNSVTPRTVGAVCYAYGVPACIHTAASKEPLGEAFLDAQRNLVRVVEHRPGYMSVLAARARDQAAADGYLALGLGLDFPPAALLTAEQVANVPRGTRRIVTAVGSGHMLEGILRGLEATGNLVPVLGVCVGSIPECVAGMETPVDVELVRSALDFNKPAREATLGDLALNPYYEAKCLPYLREGDLLWVVAY